MSTRRLVAILFSDIQGFSARMGADEQGTFALLQVHNQILESEIAAHGGRVVKTVGDAYMAEFSSSVVAVACALAVQTRLAERNAAVESTDRIHVRIGVHAGDVIVEGSDLFGDAVNLAARLEPLAPVGGVCVTEEVFRQVRRRVPGRAERLGRRTLKNLPDAVELIALFPGPDPVDSVAPPAAAPAPRRRPRVGAAVAVGLGALVASAAWFFPRAPDATRPGGVVQIGYFGALDGGGLGESYQGISRRITDLLVEGVVDHLDEGQHSPGPCALARTDPTTLALTLQPGVWFHPHTCVGPSGRPATPDDVVFSVRRAAERGTILPVEAVAREGATVRVTLARPSPLAPLFLTAMPLLPAELASCDPGPYLPGTGAFYVAEDSGTGVVTLRASPHPWRAGTPGLDTVVWRPFQTTNDALSRLATGGLDLYILPNDGALALMDPTADRAVLREPIPGISGGILGDTETNVFTHHLAVPLRPGQPLADARLRQAVAWAIAREGMTDVPWYGRPKGRILTPGVSGYDAQLIQYTHDPQRAAALLSEAGFPGGAGLPTLTLGCGLGRELSAQRIAKDLAAVGIQTRLITLSNAEARQVFDPSASTGPTVDLFLGVVGTPLLGSEPVGLIGLATELAPRLDSSTLRALADEALAAPDTAARAAVFAKLERMSLDLALSIPLAEAPSGVASGPMVVYGPRVAPWFDPVTGAFALDLLDEVVLEGPKP